MITQTTEAATPETDAETNYCDAIPSMPWVDADFTRELERERDEAREALENHTASTIHSCHVNCKRPMCVLRRERDEAREALSDWENAAAHVEADHPDEVHCGCVPVLRKLLTDARKERDEARIALASVTEAAQAVVDRWEQPSWKDTEPTATVIYRLRDALGREAE